jgi:hypothetical protein
MNLVPPSPEIANLRLHRLRRSVFQTRDDDHQVLRLKDAWRFASEPDVFNIRHLSTPIQEI